VGAGKTNEAIAIFKLNVELYPKSANVYDSLAKAYMNHETTQTLLNITKNP
jgi:predicted Zn-dependent protease